MSTIEIKTIDMAQLLMNAYELGDMINRSTETVEYVYWKQQVDQNAEVQQLIRQFDRAKEKFEECQRFGRFHPNYHEALEEVQEMERLIDAFEDVQRFKRAEQALDEMLHDISTMIARSVSDTIKVPSNDPNPRGGCNCSSGGGCSGCG